MKKMVNFKLGGVFLVVLGFVFCFFQTTRKKAELIQGNSLISIIWEKHEHAIKFQVNMRVSRYDSRSLVDSTHTHTQKKKIKRDYSVTIYEYNQTC